MNSVNNVSGEQLFKSRADRPSSVPPSENQWNNVDTFTANGRMYTLKQVESISWSGSSSWQGFVLSDAWNVKLANGNSLNLVPTELDHNSWDTLSNLAFPNE